MDAFYTPAAHTVDRSILALHKNENQFLAPDYFSSISKELDIAQLAAKYPDFSYAKLKENLAQSLGVLATEVHVANGADGVLANLLLHLRQQFAESFHMPSTYPVIEKLLDRYFYRQNDWGIAGNDASRSVVILDTPHSITGQEISDFSIVRWMDQLPESKFIIDQVYSDWKPNAELLHACTKRGRGFIVKSFSKFFGLPGLRVGFALGHADEIRALEQMRDIYPICSISDALACEALQNIDAAHQARLAMKLVKARISIRLESLGFIVMPTTEAPFIWIKHPLLTADFLEKSLASHGVLVRRYPQGPHDHNGLRVTVPRAEDEDRLIHHLEHLTKRRP